MIPQGIALFLEPQGSLREAILERKHWLEAAMPGQAYCSHPPHCTLLFGEYGSIDAWLDPLRRTVASLSPFEFETDGWQEFPNDLLAGGGHTIAYRAPLVPPLAGLQLAVAEVLARFRPPAAPSSHALAKIEPFATSLQRYGFPFVGPHWIPHFTIGSPKIPSGAPLLAKLMAGNPRHRVAVQSVSIWEIVGDSHARRHELALAGAGN